MTTVLQYPSELESKLTRKLFSGFDLHGNLGRQAIMKPKQRQKERQQQQKGKETRTWYEVTKVKVEVHVKKEHGQWYFSSKKTFWEGTMDGGDSKGRVINKKHTILG